MKTSTGAMWAMTAICFACRVTCAGVIEFEDRAAWEAASGEFTTIGFTEYPVFTQLTDEYADVGVIFTEGIVEVGHGVSGFPNDAWGVIGIGDVRMAFNSPLSWFAVDYPGTIKFDLYSGGQLIYTSSDLWVQTPSGVGGFAGFVSAESFDEVVMYDWDADIFTAMDDLHFGGVPGPGGLGLVLLCFLPFKRTRNEL